MTATQPLFACTKCHSRHPFDELSAEEHLCKNCRRQFPQITCTYCRTEFHQTKKSCAGEPACGKCEQNLDMYGQPQNCKYCNLRSAFKESRCSRCITSERKYGAPTKCNRCSLNCAFDRQPESKAKVGGQSLCLTCTMTYKRLMHSKQKGEMKEARMQEKMKAAKRAERPEASRSSSSKGASSRSTSSKISSSKPVSSKPVSSSRVPSNKQPAASNSRDPSSKPASSRSAAITDTANVAPLKAENLAVKVKARVQPDSDLAAKASQDTSNDSAKDQYADHMHEITRLREEIGSLKKVIVHKDKLILEKDKKIQEFVGNEWEQKRSMRMKMQSIQKETMYKVDELGVENRLLKKQLKIATDSKARTPRSDRLGMNFGGGICITPDIPRAEKKTDSKPATPLVEPPKEEQTDEEKKPMEEDDSASKKEADSEAVASLDDPVKLSLKAVLEADDEYTSSGMEDSHDGMTKKKRKRKNKLLTVPREDENTSSGIEDGGTSVDEASRPKKKKKRAIQDGDNDDDDIDDDRLTIKTEETTADAGVGELSVPEFTVDGTRHLSNGQVIKEEASENHANHTGINGEGHSREPDVIHEEDASLGEDIEMNEEAFARHRDELNKADFPYEASAENSPAPPHDERPKENDDEEMLNMEQECNEDGIENVEEPDAEAHEEDAGQEDDEEDQDEEENERGEQPADVDDGNINEGEVQDALNEDREDGNIADGEGEECTEKESAGTYEEERDDENIEGSPALSPMTHTLPDTPAESSGDEDMGAVVAVPLTPGDSSPEQEAPSSPDVPVEDEELRPSSTENSNLQAETSPENLNLPTESSPENLIDENSNLEAAGNSPDVLREEQEDKHAESSGDEAEMSPEAANQPDVPANSSPERQSSPEVGQCSPESGECQDSSSEYEE